MNSITVFCGSSFGNNPSYSHHAEELGKCLANNDITLVYGGGQKGLMGILSDAVLDNGGKVIGIIPKILESIEQKKNDLSEVIIVEDMHARKKMLYEKGDAFVVLPGGLGTMDEFFEAFTWNQIGIHHKKIYIINTDGYWNHLSTMIKNMQATGFLYRPIEETLFFVSSPEDIPFFAK